MFVVNVVERVQQHKIMELVFKSTVEDKQYEICEFIMYDTRFTMPLWPNLCGPNERPPKTADFRTHTEYTIKVLTTQRILAF